MTMTVFGVRAGATLLLLVALLGPAGCTAKRPDPADGVVRVDQVGYVTGATKIATLLSGADAGSSTATVVDAGGHEVLTAAIGRSRGRWNGEYPQVRPIDLSRLTRAGTYRLRVTGKVSALSPPFRVGSAAAVFGPLAEDTVGYFQAHRDGADQVDGPWRRPAAHLDDRTATVYATPSFDDNDAVRGALTPITAAAGTSGSPNTTVDVEGGWFDAGDYLKFTHTTAYALILMLLTQRDGSAPAGLPAEITHGLTWLDKMWDPATETLYTQVGIGSGDTFVGDHDTWRLPEADGKLDVSPGDRRYYQRYRPVFRAAAPGDPISPNLAGRVAAAFALATQAEARSDPSRARSHLDAAAQIFALADTAPASALVTTEPRSYYPEDSWHDDLAAAATEMTLAATALQGSTGVHDSRADGWARQATRWAKANADDGGTDPLGVYDLGALADADLTPLLTSGTVTNPDIGADGLAADLRRRLDAGVHAAAGNPMGAAAGDGGSDYTAELLGFAVTAGLYRKATGDDRYAAFAAAQRDVVLGANGWGTSLVVGAGSTYPRCPHDQIANLTVGAPIMTGAVVNGPNAAGRVRELVQTSEPQTCRTEGFAAFDQHDVAYTDGVSVSANTEPAIDFTATGMYAFALAARGL